MRRNFPSLPVWLISQALQIKASSQIKSVCARRNVCAAMLTWETCCNVLCKLTPMHFMGGTPPPHPAGIVTATQWHTTRSYRKIHSHTHTREKCVQCGVRAEMDDFVSCMPLTRPFDIDLCLTQNISLALSRIHAHKYRTTHRREESQRGDTAWKWVSHTKSLRIRNPPLADNAR